MTIREYENVLQDILNQDEGCVVLINGSWGVGKTYFWNEFVKKIDEKYGRSAYISLFGKNDINEIKSEALLQIFTKNKYIEKARNFLSITESKLSFANNALSGFGVNLPVSAIGSLLSLFEKNDLNGSIVCIDDFERKSNFLKMKEILGLSSIFSERYGCKVVLIMDEGKIIESSEGSVYEEYKEKVVSFEINFESHQAEIIDGILSCLGCGYRDGFRDAVFSSNITNLRTIIKAVKQLKIFIKHIKQEIPLSVSWQVGYKFLLLSDLYFSFGQRGLELRSEILEKRMLRNFNKIIQEDENEKIILKKWKQKLNYNVSRESKLDKIIWHYLQTLTVDTEKLLVTLNDVFESESSQEISRCIYKELDRYTFDVKYCKKSYIENVTKVLYENEKSIIEIFGLDAFVYIIETLCDISGETKKYEDFRNKAMMHYIQKKIDGATTIDELIMIRRDKEVNKILCENYGLNHLDEKINFQAAKMFTSNSASQLLKKINSQRGWEPEESELFDSISRELIKEWILSDPCFFESLIKFIGWRGSVVNSSNFKEFYENSVKVLRESKEELGAFRYKRVIESQGL